MFDMKKNVLFNFVVFVVALSCFTNCSPENDGLPASEDPVTLSIVDKQATSETKALLANLWDIQKKGFMFGHHADFYMGRVGCMIRLKLSQIRIMFVGIIQECLALILLK